MIKPPFAIDYLFDPPAEEVPGAHKQLLNNLIGLLIYISSIVLPAWIWFISLNLSCNGLLTKARDPNLEWLSST